MTSLQRQTAIGMDVPIDGTNDGIKQKKVPLKTPNVANSVSVLCASSPL